MADKTTEKFSGREVFRVVFRRKWLIVSLFLIVTVGISLAVLRQPATFEVSAKLLVKRSRGDLVLTPTDTRNANFMLSMPQTDLTAEVELIKSRSLIEAVVKRLSLHEKPRASSEGKPVLMAGLGVLGGLTAWVPAWIPAWIPWTGEVSAPGAAEGQPSNFFNQAVNTVQRGLTVQTIPNSNIIEVRFRSSDPARAADVVNALLTLHLDRYFEIHRTPGATGFFTAQRDLIEQRLRKTEEVLRSFQEAEGLLDVNAQVDAYARKLADAEQNFIDARFDLRELQAKINANKALLANQPERIVTSQETRPNPLVQSMQSKLLDLEMEREKVLQKYTEKDRRVTDNEKEIAALRQRLADAPQWVPGSETTQINPLWRDLQEKVMTTSANVERLAVREIALSHSIDEHKRRLRDLARKAVDRDRLAREVKSTEEAYLLYLRKVEEARISEAMDQSRIMNVSIAETAQAPTAPLPSRKDLSLLFAVMVGLVSGVGGAFVREFFDDSIKTAEEIKSTVALPVLAEIPEEKNGRKKNGKNGG